MRASVVVCLLLAACGVPLVYGPEVPIVAEPLPNCREPDSAKVACAVDGDTVHLGICGEPSGGQPVRLLGINAPEIAHEGNPAECWGDEAHAISEDLLAGEVVVMTFDQTCEDEYQRWLAYVWLVPEGLEEEDPEVIELDEDVVLVNEWLLERGVARLYDDFVVGLRFEERLRRAQDRAKADDAGLWKACP